MAAINDFPPDTYATHLESPALNAAAVTPSDSTDLPHVSRALYVGGAGNVTVTPAGGTASVAFTGVLAGSILPIRVSRVWATGTGSSTAIVNLY